MLNFIGVRLLNLFHFDFEFSQILDIEEDIKALQLDSTGMICSFHSFDLFIHR